MYNRKWLTFLCEGLRGTLLLALITPCLVGYPWLFWRFAPVPDHQNLRANQTQDYTFLDLHRINMAVLTRITNVSEVSIYTPFYIGNVTDLKTKIFNGRLELLLAVCGEGPDGFVAREGNLTMEDTPPSCQNIFKTDVALGDEAANCSVWCQQQLGPSHSYSLVSPFCTAAKSDVNSVCAKARTAECFKLLQDALVVGALGALYLGASIFAAKRRYNSMSWSIAAENSKPPSKNAEEPSPESFGLPFCFLHKRFGCGPKTDMERASLQQGVATPGIVIDNPLDVVGVLTFLGNGQPYYAILTGLGLLPVMVKDPLQIRGIVATLKSYMRGYATEELVEHQAREGMEEGPASGIVLVFNLFTMKALPTTWALSLRLFSVGSSLFMAIPGGAGARALLAYKAAQGLNFDDFYEVEKVKQKISFTTKYWPSVCVLYFAMSFAVLGSIGKVFVFLFYLISLFADNWMFAPDALMKRFIIRTSFLTCSEPEEDPLFALFSESERVPEHEHREPQDRNEEEEEKRRRRKKKAIVLGLQVAYFSYAFCIFYFGPLSVIRSKLDSSFTINDTAFIANNDTSFIATMGPMHISTYISASVLYMLFVFHQIRKVIRLNWFGESATWYALLPAKEESSR